MNKQYVYPNFGPWAAHQDNYLWIDIIVLDITKQSTIARSNAQAAITAEKQGTTFRLLAPSPINFGISHDWNEYENITSRLANVISSWMTPKADVSGMVSYLWEQGGKLITGNDLAKGGAGISDAIQRLVGVDVKQYRIDTPLVYKRSNPIQYIFPFEFAVFGNTGKRPVPNSEGQDIFEIINELIRFSCPKKEGNSFLEIKPPNIFHVQTYPETNMFKLQRAAITGITTDIKEHYHHGYPSAISTQITFQDITPLFEDKFSENAGDLPLVTGSTTTGLGGGASGLITK
jgi:hypothetical protein